MTTHIAQVFTRDPLIGADALARLFSILARHVPGAIPGLRSPGDGGGSARAVRSVHGSPGGEIFWESRAPGRVRGGVHPMFYPTDTHATITLECDAAAAGPDGLAGFVREVSSTFGADFGYVDVLPGADGPDGEPPGFVYLTPQNLRAWLPEMWWGTVLGPAYVDLIGGDVVASAPAHEVTRLGPATYWLQLTEHLESRPTDADPLDLPRRDVAEHLGETLFWKAGRTSFVAPRFPVLGAGQR
ncbi:MULTISPECIES: hypothetical protein [unclassified Pseudonocardia]|uniref:hypothetical protein n=1 Tax=unclassified Pseudonocardia TaxID=2619320 RepID=UPI001AC56E23|nr:MULTISPECIES: hypothetical protein [unclassified Pseudonocardia]MBN9097943.1 hypothetical protein [Pseudonocardia sp.]